MRLNWKLRGADTGQQYVRRSKHPASHIVVKYKRILCHVTIHRVFKSIIVCCTAFFVVNMLMRNKNLLQAYKYIFLCAAIEHVRVP